MTSLKGATRSSDGITMIEMIVAVTLLGIVLLPLARVFYNSLNAASSTGSRQQAAELATSVISDLRAVPYPEVGFTATGANSLGSTLTSDPSYAAYVQPSGPYFWDWDNDGSAFGTVGGNDDGTTSDSADEQLVVVTTQPSFTVGSSNTVFAPIMTNVTASGNAFTITTHLVYASSSVTACPGSTPPLTVLTQAYVRAFVTVAWNNGPIHGESLTQDSIIYPGGQAPYDGPQFNAADTPAVPTNVTSSQTSTTGDVKVSWTWQPSGSSSGCFAVGWSNEAQVTTSTGLLSNTSVPPTCSTSSSSCSASYTITGLDPGSQYVFFVIAYSGDGVESVESTDSAAAIAPSGPYVESVSPSYGPSPGGTVVTLTGTSFSVPTMQVNFGTSPSPSPATCTTSTTCTVKAPTGSGFETVTAETPTGPGGAEVVSPTLVGDQYFFYSAPTVSGVSPASGPAGTSVTVTGTNFVPGMTFKFGSASATSVSCVSADYTTCTMVAPSGSGTVNIVATNPLGSSAPSSSYQYTFS
ncbi:MAG: IPT/TIG domain-containing protein [Acidimicrobiales bacterium]